MDYDAYDAVLHHIFKQTQGDAWFKSPADNIACGVCLRVDAATYRIFPYANPLLAPFHTAITALAPQVAVKLRSAAIHFALSTTPATQDFFLVDDHTRIQVLETVEELARAEREQCAAFVRDERVLVVWAEDIEAIVPACADLERRLLKLVWRARGRASPAPRTTTPTPLRATTPAGSTPLRAPTPTESAQSSSSMPAGTSTLGISGGLGALLSKSTKHEHDHDVEKASVSDVGQTPRSARPTRIYASAYIGLATALSAVFIGQGVSVLLREVILGGGYIRLALLVTTPLIFCVSLFFCLQLINNVSFVIGPVAHYRKNSTYFSAIAPPPPPSDHVGLPHVTVQMPVYKESLESTITPSIESIKKAMLTYARQGGTSAIFVCDDGLQILPPAEREQREAFYKAQGVGWVARPPHSEAEGGYKRRGRFKKASNMNYGLALARRMEQHLLALSLDPARNPFGDDAADGADAEVALGLAVGESVRTSDPNTSANTNPSPNSSQTQHDPEKRTEGALAGNARALRLGEVILLVDSDTVVPEDCFRDAARELAESPEVAIIQHESDVMQVAGHYFENGVAYFTRRINHCISAATANGEVAPFVGHNAFLRWSAIQDAAFVDPVDGETKFWSEAHVSEDFDMSLRLQMKGYIIRWATYSKGGFKEGVSLTCDDELNRWMKYAYGCSELLFNPLKQWVFKTPVTKQIHKFIWTSSVPLHYKISMLSYMFSYYGIAGAFTLSLMNYLLLGFGFPVDGYYIRSWEMWLAVTIVFLGAGNVGITMLDYRLYHRNLLSAFCVNIKWVPFFFFFFGGLSLHLSGAILAHLFGYNMTWSATKKEVEVTNFFREFPRIMKRFWITLLICFVAVGGMIILSTSLVPLGWRIEGSGWAVIFPLAVQVGCHILYPIVLNPWLMIFSY